MKAAWICALLLLSSCGGGGRAAADDAATHSAVQSAATGSEVTFDATVVAEPSESGGHERFTVTDPAGDSLEIDHNITLAPRVPAHAGSRLVVHGRLYVDPGPHAGVHCTHAHTSKGCPVPGWIELAGQYYE